MNKIRNKIWIGIASGVRTIFRTANVPTKEAFPHFNACIGPFRTIRGAEFMRKHGGNNPHLRCVSDAERIAKALDS